MLPGTPALNTPSVLTGNNASGLLKCEFHCDLWVCRKFTREKNGVATFSAQPVAVRTHSESFSLGAPSRRAQRSTYQVVSALFASQANVPVFACTLRQERAARSATLPLSLR